MTTWQSPRLVVGEFGLPWPAVLVSPWQLTARVHRPHSLPLSDLNRPEDWDRLLPSRTVTMSLDAVNGLVLDLGPDALIPLYLGRSNQQWDTTFKVLGRAIVATADLRTYWKYFDDTTGMTAEFTDIFPAGSSAMLVQLSAASYDMTSAV